MDELLQAHPEAAEVLAAHGVDPRTRCHVGARRSMTLTQVLARVCPVDDVAETMRALHALVQSNASSSSAAREH
jgi:hypothetical protein